MRIIHWTAVILWQAEWILDFLSAGNRYPWDSSGFGLEVPVGYPWDFEQEGKVDEETWKVYCYWSYQHNSASYLHSEGFKQSLIAPLNLDFVENRGDWSKFSSLSCASVQIVNRFGDNNDNKKDFRLLFVVARDCADSSIAPPTTNDFFLLLRLNDAIFSILRTIDWLLVGGKQQKAMLSPETWFHYWMAELIKN